ncbi:MAG: cytochrome c3 family protein [Candidatus Sumerlaeota bacterium]|nr:cytochrome c3 family protein [Candidatus Sumerlaeota bacterium]
MGFEAIADGYKGKELSQAQQVDSCGRCHARRRILADGFKPGDSFCDYMVPELLDTNSYYPDGQVHEEDFEYSSFLQAKMYTKGVRCADCHDPHTTLRKREGNKLCLECHEPRLNEFAHTMHQPDSEGARCERCHMPITTYMGRDPRLDHGFTIPTPELTVEMGIPNACNRCHADKDAQWSIVEIHGAHGPPRGVGRPASAGGRHGDQEPRGPDGPRPVGAPRRLP